MPPLLAITFDVICYETSEDGAGDRRFQPRDFVLHYVSMLVRDVVVVRQCLGYSPATFQYVVTLVADGEITHRIPATARKIRFDALCKSVSRRR